MVNPKYIHCKWNVHPSPIPTSTCGCLQYISSTQIKDIAEAVARNKGILKMDGQMALMFSWAATYSFSAKG